MDEEKKKLIPKGVIYRIAKPIVKEKGCGFTPEFVDGLNKYVSQLIADMTRETCDVTLGRNKKRLAIEDLKTVGEKRGALIQ